MVSPSIGSDDTEIKFEGISQWGDTLWTTGIFADHHRFIPSWHIIPDPSGDKRLCMEIVDWFTKEALGRWSLRTLEGMKVASRQNKHEGQQLWRGVHQLQTVG